MSKRNFQAWLDSFRESIADYSYYTDFPKIYANVEAIKVELNILNSLIGSKNIKSDFMRFCVRMKEKVIDTNFLTQEILLIKKIL